MKLKEQDKKNKIISIILVIFWALLIFYFSNQKGSVSNQNSNFIIEILNKILNYFSFNLDLTNYDIFFYLIRKFAHMFLYFIFYLLIYYMFYQFNLNKRMRLAIIICFLYAISDEIHQLFIVNRSGQIIDVFIDTFGSSLALIYLFIKNKKTKLAK